MPNPNVTIKRNYNEDNDLLNLIEEAEKIIASNRNTSRIRNEAKDGGGEKLRALHHIRDELDALDAFFIPTPRLPQDDNNVLPQPAESSTSVVSMSISNNCSSSSTVTSQSSIQSSKNEDDDDDVLLITDGLAYSCNYIAPPIDIVDLCSPIYVNRHRRRRHPFTSDDQIDIIEIDDYQPLHKTKTTLPSPPKEKKSLESPTDNSNNSYNTNIIMCPICLESTANRKPKSTKCGHVFCSECIINSLRITKKCPICKRTCSEKHLITLFL